jgi:hypothetical protein
LQDCEIEEMAGILTLRKVAKYLFHTRTTFFEFRLSRGGEIFHFRAETALEEESAIFSKNERHNHNRTGDITGVPSSFGYQVFQSKKISTFLSANGRETLPSHIITHSLHTTNGLITMFVPL